MKKLLTACVTMAMTTAVLGCSSSTEPKQESGELAIISYAASSAPLLSTLTPPHAGVPFDVTVTTFGAHSCYAADHIVKGEEDKLVTLTPYNRVKTDGMGCFQGAMRIPHTVTLSFPTAGTWGVIVYGKEYLTDKPGKITATITVLP